MSVIVEPILSYDYPIAKQVENLNEKDFMEIEILWGSDICDQYRFKKNIMISKLRKDKINRIIQNF